jgi:rhamnose transport system permease protein
MVNSAVARAWDLGMVYAPSGSGTIAGVFIAAFLMGFITFGLGLLNVPGIEMTVLIGLLLILALATPLLIRMGLPRRRST